MIQETLATERTHDRCEGTDPRFVLNGCRSGDAEINTIPNLCQRWYLLTRKRVYPPSCSYHPHSEDLYLNVEPMHFHDTISSYIPKQDNPPTCVGTFSEPVWLLLLRSAHSKVFLGGAGLLQIQEKGSPPMLIQEEGAPPSPCRYHPQ